MHSPAIFRFTLALLFSLALHSTAAAAPNVSGKWKWTFQRNNGETVEVQMLAKQEGSKITGKITAHDDLQFDIRDGRIDDNGDLSFHINFERDGNSLKIDFHGKVQGDKISGKTEYTNSEGERRTMDWNAKRENSANVSGKWKSTFKRQDGSEMETELTLKQDGEKLTGKNEFNGNETELRDGKVQGDQVSFRIIRERDGRKVTSKYQGKVEGDRIKGHIESDWTGDLRRLDWEATRSK